MPLPARRSRTASATSALLFGADGTKRGLPAPALREREADLAAGLVAFADAFLVTTGLFGADFFVVAFFATFFLATAFFLAFGSAERVLPLLDLLTLVLLPAVERFEADEPALTRLRFVGPVEACLAFVPILVILPIQRE
ncbi:MAG: hypothetical protein DRI90_06585 [Deltaproteobacteria bacterium]|nr:MAG: hypothetical protein DRI90_06585 [Deltaproteobacteria bacterium]